MTSTTATTDNTTVTLTRGDELTLGATVAWTNWDGEVRLSKVTRLELLNDDVEVTGTNGLNECLVGKRHTWMVLTGTASA